MKTKVNLRDYLQKAPKAKPSPVKSSAAAAPKTGKKGCKS